MDLLTQGHGPGVPSTARPAQSSCQGTAILRVSQAGVCSSHGCKILFILLSPSSVVRTNHGGVFEDTSVAAVLTAPPN